MNAVAKEESLNFFPRHFAEMMANCLMAADNIGKSGNWPALGICSCRDSLFQENLNV